MRGLGQGIRGRVKSIPPTIIAPKYAITRALIYQTIVPCGTNYWVGD